MVSVFRMYWYSGLNNFKYFLSSLFAINWFVVVECTRILYLNSSVIIFQKYKYSILYINCPDLFCLPLIGSCPSNLQVFYT